MEAAKSFLRLYEAYIDARKQAHLAEVELASSTPTLFRSIRVELDMTTPQFGDLLGLSRFLVCGIEDGVVTPGEATLWLLNSILKEREK